MDRDGRAPAATDDRRVTLRQDTYALKVEVVHPEFGVWSGTLMDVSRGGLRFCAPVDLPFGSDITLRLPAETGLQPSEVRIVRRSQLEVSGQTWFEYGVQFPDCPDFSRHAWFLQLRRPSKPQ